MLSFHAKYRPTLGDIEDAINGKSTDVSLGWIASTDVCSIDDLLEELRGRLGRKHKNMNFVNAPKLWKKTINVALSANKFRRKESPAESPTSRIFAGGSSDRSSISSDVDGLDLPSRSSLSSSPRESEIWGSHCDEPDSGVENSFEHVSFYVDVDPMIRPVLRWNSIGNLSSGDQSMNLSTTCGAMSFFEKKNLHIQSKNSTTITELSELDDCLQSVRIADLLLENSKIVDGDENKTDQSLLHSILTPEAAAEEIACALEQCLKQLISSANTGVSVDERVHVQIISLPGTGRDACSDVDVCVDCELKDELGLQSELAFTTYFVRSCVNGPLIAVEVTRKWGNPLTVKCILQSAFAAPALAQRWQEDNSLITG